MKKYLFFGVGFLVLGLLLIGNTASAVAPNWNTTGNYVFAINYLGTYYPHNVSLTQDGLGNLTGNGSSGAYTWVITSGSVSGDNINFSANYTATPDAVVPPTTMIVTGTIPPGGTMSGTWSDNYNGGSRAGTWITTSGTAAPIAPAHGPTCSVPGDYATIQAAVNDTNCTTINVAAGIYAEHVTINHSVILNGANSGVAGNGTRVPESIVDGTDTGTPFAITANNVTIKGFTVENGSNGGFDAGIWSQTGTQNSIIQNNIITSNAFGIWAECGGTCSIENNLFDGNNKTGTGAGSASISADSTTGLAIDNNEFKNDTAGNPILFQATAAGKHVNPVVSNNNFHNNANSNIYAVGVTGANIHDNTITPASDATGISLSGADSNITITKNTINGGARAVRVEDAGYGLGNNSAITVNKNNVATDSEYGVGNTDATIANLDATCNWWGAASGPGPVGPGSGSPVTTNVNFATWLTSTDLSGPCNGPVVTPPPSSGGGGSFSGGGSGRIVPQGQVLGASTGPVPGCDNRTTGFSSTTGQSCAGNTGNGQVLGASKFIFTLFLKKGPPYAHINEVIELQKFLNAGGFGPLVVDGKFGPLTKAAVIKFQLANGLKGDGIVGPLTRAVLNK